MPCTSNLVMMIYGQFNVFPRNVGLKILKRAHAALGPGGRIVLELQAAEQIKNGGRSNPTWYSSTTGLFSDRPHLVLQENFWDEEASSSTWRFLVIDASNGAVSNYALSNEAYTDQELEEALRTAGFDKVRAFASLNGQAIAEETDMPVVVAQAHHHCGTV